VTQPRMIGGSANKLDQRRKSQLLAVSIPALTRIKIDGNGMVYRLSTRSLTLA